MLLDLGTVLAPNPTWPHALTRGRYVLVGTDAAGDREIWSVDGLAVAQAIGEGAPPATAPRLGATRPVVGTTATLQVTGALPGAAGLLVLGFDPAWIRRHAGVVPLYLDLQQPLTTALMATGASGIWSGPLAVPNVPSLIGTTLAVQNAVVSTATGIGFDASNGLLLTAGN
jgi:hypothetical protein